jgi:hypothetical protein
MIVGAPEQALDAEVVVLFEGVTETGALFSGKRSYLPTEIHWGYTFVPITHQSHSSSTFHCVDLSRFSFSPFCLKLLRKRTQSSTFHCVDLSRRGAAAFLFPPAALPCAPAVLSCCDHETCMLRLRSTRSARGP